MTLQSEYRKVRARQIDWQRVTGQRSYGAGAAVAALAVARAELALQAVEDAGLIRFDWSEYDEGRSDALDQDFESAAQRERYEADLESGAIVVERCIAEVPASKCPHCHRPYAPSDERDDWTHGASLYGVDIDAADAYGYRREVERELASEAGVIA